MQPLFSDGSLHANLGAQDEALHFEMNQTFFGRLLADALTHCTHFPYASCKPARLSRAVNSNKKTAACTPFEAEKHYQISVLHQ
jgi:hypothetical protein